MKTIAWIGIGAAVIVGGMAASSFADGRWGDGHGWGRHGGGYGHHRSGGPMGGMMGGGMGRGPGHGMAMFEEFDLNDDGALTREEIDQALSSKLAKFDGDGDKQLTIGEFEGLWLDHTRRRMVDAYQFLDDDGDGQVTEAELKRPIDRMARFADRNDDGKIDKSDMRRFGPRWRRGDDRYDDDRRDDSDDD